MSLASVVLWVAIASVIPDHLCMGEDELGHDRECQKVTDIGAFEASACVGCLTGDVVSFAGPSRDSDYAEGNP